MKKTHHHFANGLWFDQQAEEAARFYTSVFANSKMGAITYMAKKVSRFMENPKGLL